MARENALGFPVISPEEFYNRSREEMALIPKRKAIKLKGQKVALPVGATIKRPIGRPKRILALQDVLVRDDEVVLLSSSESDGEGEGPEATVGRTRQYRNWTRELDFQATDPKTHSMSLGGWSECYMRDAAR
ncbi:hypothetical protein R1sor_004651 [Riccia sorocarpa]|uniref:Uncharacterized protein n=1 Tax=Riccia sorocarpa TaxID=122646 RepID=A0ABD3HL29_9MARC